MTTRGANDPTAAAAATPASHHHLIRAYLTAVYPAARRSLHAMSAEQLVRHYESLDYYFSCHPAALADVEPRLASCLSMMRSHGASEAPTLPYLPAGFYYRTEAKARRKRVQPFHDASFTAFPSPLEWLPHSLPRGQLKDFHSQHGAKVGPAPSWTSPLALVRYPLYPIGCNHPWDDPGYARASTTSPFLHGAAIVATGFSDALVRLGMLRRSASSSSSSSLALALPPSPPPLQRDWTGGSDFADVRNMSRVMRLLHLTHGELIEVEQWGGWALDNCPPICGLWGNVWKGTGLLMRVSRPFASLSKITAIVQMLLSLGERDDAAAAASSATRSGTPPVLPAIARRLEIDREVAKTRTKHPEATLAQSIVHTLLTLHEHPCEGIADHTNRGVVQKWLKRVRKGGPTVAVADLLTLGHGHDATLEKPLPWDERREWFTGSERLRLLWAYSICGVGPLYQRCGLGWDTLLATLACLLGHQTIVLAASPNDNGLLHQEFVDFDLPEELGGWAKGGASLERCLAPFPFAKRDQKRGRDAVAERRRQLHGHWRESGKFVLPREATDAFVLPRSAARGAMPCQLRFGTDEQHKEGVVEACQLSGEDEERNRPTAKLACYAWCEGAMTQAATAQVSLFHVVRG